MISAQDGSDGDEMEHIGSSAAINAEKESGESRELERIKNHIRKAQLTQVRFLMCANYNGTFSFLFL